MLVSVWEPMHDPLQQSSLGLQNKMPFEPEHLELPLQNPLSTHLRNWYRNHCNIRVGDYVGLVYFFT